MDENLVFIGEFSILFGAFVIFSGALGIARFTEPFQRFHPPTKASLLGFVLVLFGETILFGVKTGTWSPLEFIGIVLLLAGGPFAAHVIGKALYHQRYKKEL